jgi:thymidylate synthase ThyX
MASFRCEILADSVNPEGVRLTTFEIVFPRMVLADLRTHRATSWSVESTRAIPLAQRIEHVRNDPYVPTFLSAAPGMNGGDPLVGDQRDAAEMAWRIAASDAANACEALIHTSKQHAGRLLEPFSWVSAIVSATDWENMFNLRIHGGAQPEAKQIVERMRLLYAVNEPEVLDWGEWHLPLLTPDDVNEDWHAHVEFGPAYISAGHCAATSYGRQHQGTAQEAYERWEVKLQPFGHWSPAEHPAQAVAEPSRSNYGYGWKQLRKFYPNEAVWRP